MSGLGCLEEIRAIENQTIFLAMKSMLFDIICSLADDGYEQLLWLRPITAERALIVDNQSDDQKKNEPDHLDNHSNKESKNNRLQYERRLKRKTVSDLNLIAQNYKLNFKSDMRKSERIQLLLESLTEQELEKVLDRLEKRTWIERFEEQSKHPVLRAISWIGAIAGGLTAIWAIFITTVIAPIVPDTISVKGRILSNMIQQTPIEGVTVRLASLQNVFTRSDEAGLFELSVSELKPGDHVQLICNHKSKKRSYACFTPWMGEFNIARDPTHVQKFYLCPKGVSLTSKDWANGLGNALIERSREQVPLRTFTDPHSNVSPDAEIDQTINEMAKLLELDSVELKEQYVEWSSIKNERDSLENKAVKEYANGNYLESAKLSEQAANSFDDSHEKAALFHKNSGDSFFAAQDYKKAQKQYGKALALYETVLEKSPSETWELRLSIANSFLIPFQLKAENKNYIITNETNSDIHEIEMHYTKLANEAESEGNLFRWSIAQGNLGLLNNVRGSSSMAKSTRVFFEKAEEHFNQALTVQTKDLYIEDWAHTQLQLSAMLINYSRRVSISDSDILLKKAEKAIENALGFYTKQDFPNEWACSLYNLGLLKNCRQQLNRVGTTNFHEQAIQAYKQALEINRKETNPQKWAQIHNNIGFTYYQLGIVTSGSNGLKYLIRSGDEYEKSLNIYTRTKYPINYAQLQVNLGYLYYVKALKEPANKTQHLSKAVDSLNNALEIYKANNISSELSAEAHILLAEMILGKAKSNSAMKDNQYNNKLKEGERLVKAALNVYSKSEYIQKWARAQTLLGNIYCEYAIHGNGQNTIDNFNTAISFYQNSLEYIVYESNPKEWIDIQFKIGNIFNHLAEISTINESQRYLQKSIIAYQKILQACTMEDDPEIWAIIQSLLGTVLLKQGVILSDEESINTLRRAETAFLNVTKVRSQETSPVKWAEAQDLLAVIFSHLATRSSGELSVEYSKKAIQRLENVILIYKENTDSETWGNVNYKLGTLCFQISKNTTDDVATKYIKKAIIHFKNSIKYQNPNTGQWATRQNDLALSLVALSKRTAENESIEYIEQAKAAVQKSLGVSSIQDNNPTLWAAYQDTLGVILMELGKRESGSKKREHYNNSEKAFQKSLSIFTKDAHPDTWGEVNGNYEKLKKLVKDAEMESKETSMILQPNQFSLMVVI